MELKDFNYELPKELIAQEPCENREQSRLLILDKDSGNLDHKKFKDIINYLSEDDCLVMNDTKVIPARLYGHKEETGAEIEVFLLNKISEGTWEVLVRPGKKVKEGSRIIFNEELSCCVLDIIEGGNRIVKFEYDGIFMDIIDRIGLVPLPPYITKKLEDSSRYQTVYAKIPGSAAAPTAGLHFSDELIKEIEDKGVITAFVTLNIGLGTFRPVKVNRIEDHLMHSEYYSIGHETCEKINRTKQKGGRIISVGTTGCRVLETAAGEDGRIQPSEGWTNIFIYPGYKFKIIDALITNFHLPESTLLMLVSAFAGRENIMKAYNEAVENRYRFFSFGDAMLIK